MRRNGKWMQRKKKAKEKKDRKEKRNKEKKRRSLTIHTKKKNTDKRSRAEGVAQKEGTEKTEKRLETTPKKSVQLTIKLEQDPKPLQPNLRPIAYHHALAHTNVPGRTTPGGKRISYCYTHRVNQPDFVFVSVLYCICIFICNACGPFGRFCPPIGD